MDTVAIKKQLSIIRKSCDTIDSLISPAGVINVGVGADLPAILNAAPAGSILSIDPAFVMNGDLTVPKTCSMISATPVSGRVTKSMPGPTINGSIILAASLISLVNLRIQGVKKEPNLITTNDNTTIDGCVVMGSPLGQHRGILANSKNVKITKSYIYNIWGDIDTQGIAAWNGCKNLTIDNCYVEASGENILFGGADASSLENLPQDIVINNCDLFKPLTWKGRGDITVKNLFEIKAAQRIKVTNCNMTNCWVSGQDGYGILINVRNQDGNAPFTVIEDVEISNCFISNTVAGMQFLGKDYANPSGLMKRVIIKNNRFTGLDSGRQIFIKNGSEDLTFDGNSFEGSNLNSAFSFDQNENPNTRFSVEYNSFQEGEYGIIGTDAPALGKAVLDMYASGYFWDNNIIYRGSSGRIIQYPTGTILK